MNTFLKKISCGSSFIIEFPSEVKLEFGIAPDAYISFVVSKRGAGNEVVFEKGQLAGNVYEDWSLEIETAELNCELPNQILENNKIYNYQLAVYEDGVGGTSKFYVECYLLTKNIFGMDETAYKAVVLSYTPGYYKGAGVDSETQSVTIPFYDYRQDLPIDSAYVNPGNTRIFGFDYVLGSQDPDGNLVFKSGTYELAYDEATDLWYVPKEQLVNGDWHYSAQVSPVSWSFSTKFGWIDARDLNDEMGVAMHSYRRGFSYETEPSASGWMFGAEQSSNFNYEDGLVANTRDGLVGGPSQRLSVVQNAIKTTTDVNWRIFKANYYKRYNLRGFLLSGVERIVDSSTISLKPINPPLLGMDSALNLFIQDIELEVGSSSSLGNHIEKDDLLVWTAVLDAQSRNVSVDWTRPAGYSSYWTCIAVTSSTVSSFTSSNYSSFSFDLDVPVTLGKSDDFNSSEWSTENPALMPIAKDWMGPAVLLESSGQYMMLAGFTRGGGNRFILEGDETPNIVTIANDPSHYLWNAGDVFDVWGEPTAGNVLANNLAGNGTTQPIFGRARPITITFSFDPPTSSSSSESSAQPSGSSEESSSSWNPNWATEGYLLGKLQGFVTYLGQIGKTTVSQNIGSANELVSGLDTVMANVGGLATAPTIGAGVDSGTVVNIGQVQSSFRNIESRFGSVADMAYAYGSAVGTQFDSVTSIATALYNLNNVLIQSHAENPTIASGSGETALKSDVDDFLTAEIAKYVGIADDVLSLKAELDAQTSIGVVYLGNTLVGLCDLIQNVGVPMTLPETRMTRASAEMNPIVESSSTVALESEYIGDVGGAENHRALTSQKLFLRYYQLGGVQTAIVDWGTSVSTINGRYQVYPTRVINTVFSKDYPVTPGEHSIKFIVPTYLNYQQNEQNGWGIKFTDPFRVGVAFYDEMAVTISDLSLNMVRLNNERGMIEIFSDDPAIFFGRMGADDEFKKFTSGQKIVPLDTAAAGSGDTYHLGWHFPGLFELNLPNPNLTFEDRTEDYNHFSYIGNNVRREQPFPAWRDIWVLAGTGTKIVLNIGATDLLGKTGFPFGAQTKHYFKCTNPADVGYIIYDGTKWIIWKSNIPEDYWGPIPNWPDDVTNANYVYLNLTYTSTMDHGVFGTIPDWNNVETANSTFRVDGNDESPVCTDPSNNSWQQNRDTSSVYGTIPEWGNVTSALSTYYGQGFLDAVWDYRVPFAELMPSTVAHDAYTVKGTSAALRVYFTAAWGGLLEMIDSLSANSLYFIANVDDDWYEGTGSAYTVKATYWSDGSSVDAPISCFGNGGYVNNHTIDFRPLDHSVMYLLQVPKSSLTDYPYIRVDGNYAVHIEAIVGCPDFNKMSWVPRVKRTVERVNVASHNHDVSGFQSFKGLAIVEIIPGTTTSGQHILDNCFNGCTSLETVILPNCITIGANAFEGCTALTQLSFPNCTTVGTEAFSGCDGLTSISLPSCTSAGATAFSGCINVASIQLGTLVPDGLGTNCFSGLGTALIDPEGSPNQITTYVDVGNTAAEILLFDGFDTGWGAGANVAIRCSDGIVLTMVNGTWARTLTELRLVSEPSAFTYEIVAHSDEEYELPRNTGLEIDAVFSDAAGNETTSIDVTNDVLISKINIGAVENGVIASWTYDGITRTVNIPVTINVVPIGNVTRSLLDFVCTYKTTEYTADERVAPIDGTDYYFYDVKIYKEDLEPIATYHVEHNNGIEANITLNVFAAEESSSDSSRSGPYIEEFANGEAFITRTLRDGRLTDDSLGFGVCLSNVARTSPLIVYGYGRLDGPTEDGLQQELTCETISRFSGDTFANMCIISNVEEVRTIMGQGLSTTNPLYPNVQFGQCLGSVPGWEHSIYSNYLISNPPYYAVYPSLKEDFDLTSIKQYQNAFWKPSSNRNVVYLRLDLRRNGFCHLTLVDNGIQNSQNSYHVDCRSLQNPKISIWMPFVLNPDNLLTSETFAYYENGYVYKKYAGWINQQGELVQESGWSKCILRVPLSLESSSSNG